MSMEYTLDNGVSRVVMDDGKANALNDAWCDGIDAALDRAAADRAGALVLAGRPGVFSAGIDLGLLRSDDASARAASLTRVARTVLRLWLAPLPTVAAVTGHAMAGGAVLALACDRRLAVDVDAKVGLNETALGLVMPTWALVVTRAGVRAERLTEVMLSARLYTPADAVATGIVEECVDPDLFEMRVDEVARGLTALPTRAYAGTKRMLRGADAALAESRVDEEMGSRFAPVEDGH